MKKQVFYFLLTLFVAGFTSAKADEGMWLPSLIGKLNYTDMQKLGCKLTAEEIYNVNHSSLKDAILQLQTDRGSGQLSGFCTGEIISGEGLMLTNHHCGFAAIASQSSVEHDYLSDGFWAMTKAEELPIKGLAVSRVVRIEDVTDRVAKTFTKDMDEEKRADAMKKVFKEITDDATKGSGYTAKVKEMFAGNEYYLFVYEVFKDVRLVGAPPSSIGKFGGDTDNWMWPRQTGDFSMFRVYMGKDGKPAEYSKDNVPYKPMHVLPISIKGLEENDYAMIMGYPGTTERYLPSVGMEYQRDTYNPTIAKLFGTKLKLMKEAMNASDAIRIAISDKYASTSNTWKNKIGEARNLRQTDAIAQRKKIEGDMTRWIDGDVQRKAEYGNVMSNFESAYTTVKPISKLLFYASVGLMQGCQMTAVAQQFMGMQKLLEDPKTNKEALDKSVGMYKENINEMYKKYYPELDRKIFTAFLTMYNSDIASADRVNYFNEVILKKSKSGNADEAIAKFVEEVYAKSIFTDKARLMKFLEKPTLKALKADILVDYTASLSADLQANLRPAYMKAQDAMAVNERLYIKALREMNNSKSYYPDANSTLRLSYGSVKSYDPYDGAHYKFQTYLDGVIAKMDNTSDEFKVPAKLVDLYEKKDFGPYMDKTGKMPVAFLTTNDITGGNSGSPVINGKGELIGAAYDGNWEWLTGDLIYNSEVQRTICVDVRYVLFIVDKYAGAKNLISEMNIVK